MFNFFKSKGQIQFGIKFFWYEFVQHVLYFVESAAALIANIFCLNVVNNATL